MGGNLESRAQPDFYRFQYKITQYFSPYIRISYHTQPSLDNFQYSSYRWCACARRRE